MEKDLKKEKELSIAKKEKPPKNKDAEFQYLFKKKHLTPDNLPGF